MPNDDSGKNCAENMVGPMHGMVTRSKLNDVDVGDDDDEDQRKLAEYFKKHVMQKRTRFKRKLM